MRSCHSSPRPRTRIRADRPNKGGPTARDSPWPEISACARGMRRGRSLAPGAVVGSSSPPIRVQSSGDVSSDRAIRSRAARLRRSARRALLLRLERLFPSARRGSTPAVQSAVGEFFLDRRGGTSWQWHEGSDDLEIVDRPRCRSSLVPPTTSSAIDADGRLICASDDPDAPVKECVCQQDPITFELSWCYQAVPFGECPDHVDDSDLDHGG